MSDCLFCKFIKGEIPTEKIFENEQILGFKDIYPQAKEHYLFVHKSHTKNVNEMSPEQIGAVYSAIKEYTEKEMVNKGFRVVTNYGENAGQTIFHTHFHVLGGEKLSSFGS